MRKVFILTFCLSVLFSFSALAQNEEKITGRFFQTYQVDPLKAYDELFSEDKWTDKTEIETIKVKLKGLLKDLGAFHGAEVITTKKVGESYILKSFLLRYDRQPLRFTFILYKPTQKWQLQNVSYDANIGEELEAAAKIDRLKENW